MSAEFWITTAAIVIGPVIAVLISWCLQDRASNRDRKLYILRALLSTRKMQLSPDRVMALNLVEVEFHGVQKVMDAYKPLFAIYCDRPRWQNEDQDERTRLEKDLSAASTRLIEEIAKALGFKFEQLEIRDGGYAPEAYEQREKQEHEIRDYIVRLSRGNAFVPFALLDARHPRDIVEQTEETLRVYQAERVRSEMDSQ